MFVLKRLLSSLPTLFVVSLLVFWLVNLLPGDPAIQIAGPTATPDEVAQIRDHLGLNQSAPVRYVRFLRGIVDPSVATSFRTTRPVAQEIAERLPKTVAIAVGALLVGLLIGTVTGIICAIRQGTWVDTAVTVLALAGISMPVYWLGLLCVWFFAVYLGWLPAAGASSPAHFILPILVVSTRPAALFSRLVTANLLEVMGKDFLDTARSKGVSETRVIAVHALRNSLVAAVSVAGVQFGTMLGGSVVTENVFGVPGVGRLLVQAVAGSDFPVIQYSVLMFAVFFIFINLVTDIVTQWLDPRTRQPAAH